MKTPGRRTKRLLVALGVILLVGDSAGIALVAWEWTYIDRLRHFPKDVITNVAWYTPRERIPGGNGASLPRAKFDYNNVNFQALGFVIQTASGKRFAAYLSEKLWTPLGASDASVWLDREGGSARASGIIFADPEDTAKVGLMLLYDGEWNGRQIVPIVRVGENRRGWDEAALPNAVLRALNAPSSAIP